MKRKTAIVGTIVVATLLFGCNREQQPIQTAANCPSCADVEAERDQLNAELGVLRELAARRQAIYDELRRELDELITAGRVRLVFRRGMIVMQLPNQILFGAGRAELTSEGQETMAVVGESVANITDRRFLVAGHTDDQPIRASAWTSNWQLSSARAQVVLDVMVQAGVSPGQLAAAGFGEYDPVENNDSPEGQSQNRRTEIMVVPNLEQVFRSVQESE